LLPGGIGWHASCEASPLEDSIMSDAAPALDWPALGMALFGGLARFLAGLELLSEGLRKAAGHALRAALGRAA
jgi:hypothetical protein